jgi:hypothetical protein
MDLNRLRELAGLPLRESFEKDASGKTTWSGHEVISNRKTPKGDFLVLKNKNDGKYEIHKQVGKDTAGGLEFKSAHKTPEEMQVAFKKLTGVD